MIAFSTPSALRGLVGQHVATSDWVPVNQDRITAFADATEDHQWIHVDADRAQRETPFGTTIAHGFLTLSLVSALLRNAVSMGGLRMAINYGLNRVRFVSPLPAGSRVRAQIVLANLQENDDNVQATWQVTVEREGAEKPCVVAEWIVRYYPAYHEHEGRERHEGHEG